MAEANLTDNFTARIVQRANTAGVPVRWANTHELNGVGITGDAFVDPVLVADALAAFHQKLLLPGFLVESVVLSSFAPDGSPYNPDTFFSRTYMLRGSRVPAEAPNPVTTALPIVNTLMVKKLVESGREGTMLLRGFLSEGDVQSDALTGAVTLTEAASIATVIQSAWTALEEGFDGAVVMALLGGTGSSPTTTRVVSGLRVKSVSSKKLNNKYFDKAPSNGFGGIFDGLVDQYGAGIIGNIIEYIASTGGELPLLP